MHILLAVGVTLLTATLPDQGQSPLAPASPVNITFVKASFEEAVSTIAHLTGLTIEIDHTVSEELRREPIAEGPVNLRGTTIEDSLDFLTSGNGLAYSIVNAQTVRIHRKG
jgi:hypothetical protein